MAELTPPSAGKQRQREDKPPFNHTDEPKCPIMAPKNVAQIHTEPGPSVSKDVF